MNWTNTAVIAGPYVILFLVIALSLGYIILLFTKNRSVSESEERMNIPPPESATNYVTQGIGNSLSATGMADIDESMLSKKI
jgi:ABC-type Fe3+ transport system permease subunit